jgi:putative sterol carrier protein
MPETARTRAAIAGRTDAEILSWIERVGGVDVFLEQAFSGMQDAFVAERAGDRNAVIEWDIATPDRAVRRFQVRIEAGHCEVDEAETSTPTVVLGVQLADFVRLILGTLDGQAAADAGRLAVSGDLELAGELKEWFPAG